MEYQGTGEWKEITELTGGQERLYWGGASFDFGPLANNLQRRYEGLSSRLRQSLLSQEGPRKPGTSGFCHWRSGLSGSVRSKEACTHLQARGHQKRLHACCHGNFQWAVTTLRWLPHASTNPKGSCSRQPALESLTAHAWSGKSGSGEMSITGNESITTSLVVLISC